MSQSGGRGRGGAKENSGESWCTGFDPSVRRSPMVRPARSVEPSFYGWRRELQRRDRKRSSQVRPTSVCNCCGEVSPPGPATDRSMSKLIVRLTSGVRLYVTVEQLPAVLDVLESRPC